MPHGLGRRVTQELEAAMREYYDVKRVGRPGHTGNAAHVVGLEYEKVGMHAEAIEWHRRDVKCQKQAKALKDEAPAHHRLVICLLETRKFDDAIHEATEELRCADRLEGKSGKRLQQEAHDSLGRAYQSRADHVKESSERILCEPCAVASLIRKERQADKDVRKSVYHFAKSLRLAEELREPELRALALHSLAGASAADEKYADAARHFSDAIALYAQARRRREQLRSMAGLADVLMDAGALDRPDERLSRYSAEQWVQRVVDGCAALTEADCDEAEIFAAKLASLREVVRLRSELLDTSGAEQACAQLLGLLEEGRHHANSEVREEIKLLCADTAKLVECLKQLAEADDISRLDLGSLREFAAECAAECVDEKELAQRTPVYRATFARLEAELSALRAREPDSAQLSLELAGAQEQLALGLESVRDYAAASAARERSVASLRQGGVRSGEKLANALFDLANCLEKADRPTAQVCAAYQGALDAAESEAMRLRALDYRETSLSRAAARSKAAEDKKAAEAAWHEFEACEARHLASCPHAQQAKRQAADEEAAASARRAERDEAQTAEARPERAHAPRAERRAHPPDRHARVAGERAVRPDAPARAARGRESEAPPAAHARKGRTARTPPPSPAALASAHDSSSASDEEDAEDEDEEAQLQRLLERQGTYNREGRDAQPIPPAHEPPPEPPAPPAPPPAPPPELVRALQSGTLELGTATAAHTLAVVSALARTHTIGPPPLPAAVSLRALCLCGCLLSAEAVACLLRAGEQGLLAAVHALELNANWLAGQEDSLDALCAHCGSADGGLRVLGLAHCSLSRLPRALSYGGLARVQAVCAPFNPLSGEDRLGLLEQQPLGQLALLDLHGCGLEARDVEHVARTLAPSAGELLSIDLSQSKMGLDGAAALATLVRGCAKLHTLRLAWCALELAASTALLDAREEQSRLLSMRGNKLSIDLTGSALPAGLDERGNALTITPQ